MTVIKETPKFNIGDKVRIVNPSNYDTIKSYVGLEGKVTSHKGMYHVSFDKNNHNVFFEDELELVSKKKQKRKPNE